MYEFFKGWRRKTGVLTLLMALVFAGAWVRGQTTEAHNQLSFIGLNNSPHILFSPYILFLDPEGVHWGKFGVVHDGNREGVGIQVVWVPHWAIVIPLTLLSAYLLVSKLRKKTQETIGEAVEFFRGWKRKIGVLTLFMTLAFMGLWIRGHGVTDLYEFGNGHGTNSHTLVLSQHGIMWMRLEVFGDSIMSWTPGWNDDAPSSTLHNEPKKSKSPADIRWRWSWCGFDFCQTSHDTDERYSHQNIPYWAIVLPLALISLWLLFKRPSKSTQEKIGGATENEGA